MGVCMSKRPILPEEKELWNSFTHNVHRIGGKEVYLSESSKPSHEVIIIAETYTNPTCRSAPHIDLQPDDMSNINKRTAQRLRRGLHKPQATLDMHGFTQAEAIHQFHHFLVEAANNDLRVLRVITGYGKMNGGNGVLRAALPRWVNLPENRRLILSYHQARPQDGGAGAWILLLKRRERL